MQRRATSKKRAAEAEQEIDMGDKEVTPVEDVETLLTPMEPKRTAKFKNIVRSPYYHYYENY